MQRTVLGRTGLDVSVAGLGGGGPSGLGRQTGRAFDESVALVRSAFDLGINYFDTAAAYGTESIIGRALADVRDEVVLSTKAIPYRPDKSLFTAQDLRTSVEQSLRDLDTSVIDVFHLHAIPDRIYDYCVAELLPELEALRERGLIRFLALSEQFIDDPGHVMLQRAVPDGYWDVVMVGFSILNRSARERVFPLTQANNVGVEVMFAVRRALGDPANLRALVAQLVADGHIKVEVDVDHPLGFLIHPGGASSVVNAAYRLARHEPGCDVILTGTGSVDHLRENVRSLEDPPLPAADRARIDEIFDFDDITGN